MKLFCALYAELDRTTKIQSKLDALIRYFQAAPPADAAWALFFLVGKTPPRGVTSTALRRFVAEYTGFPEWLVEDSYEAVGDLAETVSLLVPGSEAGDDVALHDLVESIILPLRAKPEDEVKAILAGIWTRFTRDELLVFHKLITGGFRIGVSSSLVIRALQRSTGVNEALLAQRLLGAWEPTPDDFLRLTAESSAETLTAQPYPFYLASPLEESLESLGDPSEWYVDWKWDGIRAQVGRRGDSMLVWSRSGDVITHSFPELEQLARQLPHGTYLDGEILAWDFERRAPKPFQALQARLQRKRVTAQVMKQTPIYYVVYDLLEDRGEDVRSLPITERRQRLEQLLEGLPHVAAMAISPLIECDTWAEVLKRRGEARERGVEGVMLKRRTSHYGVGRKRGDWWKLKVDPFTVDAVLIYAQAGHGRRAGLFTDYTFAVWDNGKLVPVAKAYSGLTDQEILVVDEYVRKNTTERFGPIRSVTPKLVFEIAFEAIQRSTRHKSGIALRFPRILRQRADKTVDQADSIEQLRLMLATADVAPGASEPVEKVTQLTTEDLP